VFAKNGCTDRDADSRGPKKTFEMQQYVNCHDATVMHLIAH